MCVWGTGLPGGGRRGVASSLLQLNRCSRATLLWARDMSFCSQTMTNCHVCVCALLCGRRACRRRVVGPATAAARHPLSPCLMVPWRSSWGHPALQHSWRQCDPGGYHCCEHSDWALNRVVWGCQHLKVACSHKLCRRGGTQVK